MDNKIRPTHNFFKLSDERLCAMREAVNKAVLNHKRAGNPIAIWQDGKVVIVPPEEIVLPEMDESDAKPGE